MIITPILLRHCRRQLPCSLSAWYATIRFARYYASRSVITSPPLRYAYQPASVAAVVMPPLAMLPLIDICHAYYAIADAAATCRSVLFDIACL